VYMRKSNRRVIGPHTTNNLDPLLNSQIEPAAIKVQSNPDDPEINMEFWYDDEFLRRTIIAQGHILGFKFTNNMYGGNIQNEDGSVYLHQGRSFTIVGDQVIGTSKAGTEMKLAYLEQGIRVALETHATTKEHIVFFALDINQFHWCAGQLVISEHDTDVGKIKPKVLLTINDSGNYLSQKHLQHFRNNVETVLQKFTKAEEPLNIEAKRVQYRRQTDPFSCGPITVSIIWEFTTNTLKTPEEITPYTAQEIFAMRANHLRWLNDPILSARQKDNIVPASLSPKPDVSELASNLLSKFEELLAKLSPEASKELKMLCLEFLIAEIRDEVENLERIPELQIQQLEHLNALPEAAELAAQQYPESRTRSLVRSGIKLCFDKQELLLKELGLFDCFFEAERSKTEKELLWKGEGIHTFVHLLLELFQAPVTMTIVEVKDEQPFNIDTVSKAFELDGQDYSYSFQGKIDRDGRLHGYCEHQLELKSGLVTKFRGVFFNGTFMRGSTTCIMQPGVTALGGAPEAAKYAVIYKGKVDRAQVIGNDENKASFFVALNGIMGIAIEADVSEGKLNFEHDTNGRGSLLTHLFGPQLNEHKYTLNLCADQELEQSLAKQRKLKCLKEQEEQRLMDIDDAVLVPSQVPTAPEIVLHPRLSNSSESSSRQPKSPVTLLLNISRSRQQPSEEGIELGLVRTDELENKAKTPEKKQTVSDIDFIQSRPSIYDTARTAAKSLFKI
jgi:hypothetical protein